MASRAPMKETLPETLPGDFVEWDEASPSPQPMHSGYGKPGPGIGVVSKPAAPAPEAHRSGAQPANRPPAAAPLVSPLETTGGAAALRPAQSLNAALLSARDIQLQEALPALDEHR